MPWEYWLDSVLTGNFKMSRPSEFNDPFDCIGAEKGEYSSQVIDDFVEKNYTSDFGSRELFKNIFQSEYKVYDDDACRNRSHLDSLLLIMSMTDAKKVDPQDELLMWSHYAGNAKGVRILFDIPDCDDKYFLAHVSYDSRIPCFDRSLATSYKEGIAFIEVYKKMIYTKSNAWKYENEVRLILHEPDWDPYRIDMNGMSFLKCLRNG